MFSVLRQSVLMFLALTVVTGLAYPLAMTLVGQGLFPRQANGSLIERDGKIVVAGDSYNGSNRDFALVRYLSDGSLDTIFGTGGKVTQDFFGLRDVAKKLPATPETLYCIGSSTKAFTATAVLMRAPRPCGQGARGRCRRSWSAPRMRPAAAAHNPARGTSPVRLRTGSASSRPGQGREYS